jgi:hypothetical protein
MEYTNENKYLVLEERLTNFKNLLNSKKDKNVKISEREFFILCNKIDRISEYLSDINGVD